jgi:hypothetical protein
MNIAYLQEQKDNAEAGVVSWSEMASKRKEDADRFAAMIASLK